TLWCATLLRDRAHMSDSAAATGDTALVAGMAVGRFAGGWLALRVSLDRLLFAAFATSALGFALFWLSAEPVSMFAGLAVAGMSTHPYEAPETQSQHLFDRARAVTPGGVNSPVRAFRAVGGTPRFMASDQGAYLTDVDGTRYVVMVCSWGPLILGHAHPAVVE